MAVQPSAPVALSYLRVSAEEQALHGVSLAVQRVDCQRYAAAHGWTEGTTYLDMLSGLKDSRPQYQALLEEARRLRADGREAVVVVSALDRLGRRLPERIRLREELKALGVPVHSVREGGELTDLVANVLAAIAQEDVRRHAQRVSASLQHARALGWYGSGGPPWGYRYRASTPAERAAGALRRTLEPDPDQARTVLQAFRRYARGQSMRAVQAWLGGRTDAERGGYRFKGKAMSLILRAPVYVARHRADAPASPGASETLSVLERPAGRWPSIVPEPVWREVQYRLERVELKWASGRALLTGFVRCATCGRPAGAGSSVNRSRYYSCAHCRPGKRAYIAARAPLDRIVLAEVCSFLEKLRVHRDLSRGWRAAAAPREERDQTEASLHDAVQRARRRLARAGAMLVAGDLDTTGYELVSEHAQREAAGAQASLDRLAALRARRLPTLGVVRRWLRSWEARLSGDTVVRRSVLTALLEAVHVRRVALKRYDVTLCWTALGRALHSAAGLPCLETGTLVAASR